jgi:malic enzyme
LDAGATAAGVGAGLLAAFEALFDATLMPFGDGAAGLAAALLLSDWFDFVTDAAAVDLETFIHLA